MNTGSRLMTPRCLITINGVPMHVDSWTTQHGVKQPVGTATIDLPLLAADNVASGHEVVIQAGYRETGTSMVFRGLVTEIDNGFDASGASVRLRCDGHMRRMRYQAEGDLVFTGSTLLSEIVKSLTSRRNIPTVVMDDIRFINSSTRIRLGGNEWVDDGNVIVGKRQDQLQWALNALELFGYQLFERPRGDARVMRVGGLPNGGTLWCITEGVDALRLSRNRSLYQRADYVDVTGASYTDGDGVAVKIRSFPAMVVEPDYVIRTLSSSLLVSQALADLARNVIEINEGESSDTQAYRTRGLPELQPGDSVKIASPSIQIPAASAKWVMAVRHEWGSRGFWTNVETWAGSGQALAAGDDALTIPVASGPIHLGDETISWYASPAPSGAVYRIPFTVPDEFTAILMRWKGHGSNSYFLDGADSESSVSKMVVTQNGEEVGSVDLPMLPENYAQQLNYTNLANWIESARPVPGQLEPGAAEIEIRAGTDSSASGGPVDDFELRDIEIVLTGAGRPGLPEVR